MTMLLDNRPLLFALSGPSGAGKSTALSSISRSGIASRLTTYTTRPPRRFETNGLEYHFLTKQKFFQLYEEHEIIEYWMSPTGHYYGSPATSLQPEHDQPLAIQLDVLGFWKIRATSARRVVGIFVSPPSPQILLARLSERDGTCPSLENCERDYSLLLAHASTYDYLLINGDLEPFLEDLEALVSTEIRRSESARWMSREGLTALFARQGSDSGDRGV